MKVIGITGGVGSGKSEVLKFLEQEYGAVVCQMDEVAKQIQKKGTQAFSRIVQEFGEQIVGNNGELDRMKLGSCVFADEKKLQILNNIVHPEVLEWVRKDILKKKEERLEKLQNSMIEYHKAAAIIQGHRIFIFRMFVVTLIQRLIHFSITYLVYRAMGLSALGFIDVVALQSVISISVDMLPLPGGMGISEGLFLNIFKKIFIGGLLYPAMLLSRGISYYALVLISAVMTGVAHVTIKRKE